VEENIQLERYNTSSKHAPKNFRNEIQKYPILKFLNRPCIYYWYEFYLISVRNCVNTAVKYIENFSKINKICLTNHWIERNHLLIINRKLKKSSEFILSEGEIQNIIKKDFQDRKVCLSAHIFPFSQFLIGVLYIDVKNLKIPYISIGIDLREVDIYPLYMKTGTESKIPIPVANYY
jgi:hypothetical protein